MKKILSCGVLIFFSLASVNLKAESRCANAYELASNQKSKVAKIAKEALLVAGGVALAGSFFVPGLGLVTFGAFGASGGANIAENTLHNPFKNVADSLKYVNGDSNYENAFNKFFKSVERSIKNNCDCKYEVTKEQVALILKNMDDDQLICAYENDYTSVTVREHVVAYLAADIAKNNSDYACSDNLMQDINQYTEQYTGNTDSNI